MQTKEMNISIPSREFTMKFRYGNEDCEIVFRRVTLDEVSQIRKIAEELEQLEKEGGEVLEMKKHIERLFDAMVISKSFDWPITNLPMASIRAVLEPAMREQGIPEDKKK